MSFVTRMILVHCIYIYSNARANISLRKLTGLFYCFLFAGFHKAPQLNQIFPESCLLIVIGVIIGITLSFGKVLDVSPLTPNTFFLYMLPPIIFDAGYFMPNRLFFDHLGTILLMAVVGTIFNIATIGESRTPFSLCFSSFRYIDDMAVVDSSRTANSGDKTKINFLLFSLQVLPYTLVVFWVFLVRVLSC